MTFKWTAEQRAQVVEGATMCIDGSPNHDSGRYEVTSAGERFVFLRALYGGPALSVPWHRCDPDTLCLPPDPRQLDMFGGGK